MLFTETKLRGAYIVEPSRLEDERGFFARTCCQRELKVYNLNPNFVQCSISFNKKMGTVRGMHYQLTPHAECKLVRCTMGAVLDIILDLRSKSTTFKKWVSVTLTAENRKMLYIPEGFAHGFQTLKKSTEVFYQITEFYDPDSAKGLRWDDPEFNIKWPLAVSVISEKDLSYPLWGK